MADAIPRPNLDLPLEQTRRLIKTLQAHEQTPDIMIRIQTLQKWVTDRERNPIVPPEYRQKRYRLKEPIPLGYAHDGPNFNFPFKP